LLIAKLDGLPLALAQAGSFIGQTGVEVPTYIEFFDKTWSDLMEKQDQFPLQEYGERSMLATWKISYDHVLRRSKTAAWLLRLWAFFYYDDFWYGLLSKSHEIALNVEEFKEVEPFTWLFRLTASELEFSSAMGLLKAYSLADIKGEGSYTMHPVLHQWSRSLSMDSDAVLLCSVSISVLGSVVSLDYDVESWKLDRRLLQHVLHASNEWRMAQPPAQQKLISRLTHHLSLLLQRQGKLHEAEWMLQLTLTSEERALGLNHKLTLETLNDLGHLYSRQGKLDEAEQMLERALSGREEELGPNHKSTLITVIGIGALYINQGKLDKAEEMHQRALTSCEKALGPDHRLTLQTINNLGNIYSAQGRLDESEQMYKRALVGFEKAHGKGALIVSLLRPVFNLGFLYYKQGRLDQAEKMYERALAGYQEIHGRSHQEVLEAAECLAVVRSEKGVFFHPALFPDLSANTLFKAARDAESLSEAASAPDEHSVVSTRKRKRNEQETTTTLHQTPDPPRP
jgi:tetratricopeptide (TPR) repeat protein